MQLLTDESRPIIEAAFFREELAHGDLWVPADMREHSWVLWAALRSAMAAELPFLRVHVNTINGDGHCWYVARAIEEFANNCRTAANYAVREYYTEALVTSNALSAGLIVAVACERRVCGSNTHFQFHGSSQKGEEHKDQRKAEWFGARTALPEAEWMRMAQDGEPRDFGAEQALEWGVVHEIIDD